MKPKPKFKVDDVVQNIKQDYSDKNLVPKILPARSVGRVRRVYLMPNPDEWLVYVKFYGHPLLVFRENELEKAQLPKISRKLAETN